MNEQLEKLRAFAQGVLAGWPDDYGYMEAQELHDLAVKHGLLEASNPKEPCRDGCNCTESYSSQDFKAGEVVCFRPTPLLTGF